MKFLVVRFSSIGDIVLTTPVIRCLKTQVATAEIHYITKARFASILEANPYIDRIHTIENDLAETMVEQLQKEDFDYILDLHHNMRTYRLKRALKKPVQAFPKLNLEKWLLTNFKINRMPKAHIVDRYMQTVAPFGVKYDGRGLDYFIPEQWELKTTDIPTGHQAGYIGLVIGAALGTKRYPIDQAIEFCKALPHPIIVLGGKEDAEDGERIAQTDPLKIYNACGKFNLHESAGLVKQAKLIVTNDTGLMHIAAAFRKPIVSLWGNTVPELGMYPFCPEGANISSTMLQVEGLKCRPCSKIGYQTCPKKHFHCMKKIEPLTVLQAVLSNI